MTRPMFVTVASQGRHTGGKSRNFIRRKVSGQRKERVVLTGSDVDSLAREIREFINRRRVHYGLFQDKRRFHQLWTCLDVIEDCELAIEAYVSPSAPRRPDLNKGDAYLALFGVLQAFFVQQDAVDNLADALKVSASYRDDPGLIRIREVRNMTSGHPTKLERRRITSFHAINRSSLGKNSFELLSATKNGTAGFQTYSVADLIADQQAGVSRALRVILDKFTETDRLHRSEFRHERLESALNDHADYFLEKLGEGLSPLSPSGGPLAGISVSQLGKALDAFQEALERRGLGLDTYDSVRDAYPKLRYALAQLASFFDGRTDTEIPNAQIAEMVISYVRHGVRSLRQLAVEIDEDYAS